MDWLEDGRNLSNFADTIKSEKQGENTFTPLTGSIDTG
ncbi:hypothetical protein J2S11_002815 [Bacillus horti]|uniref:Uncharacterized protein n=1 Tax=Caldalkalibacillus horti TaxID=77523 RepID=A0ABT9W0X3_9BACI|nr:hypothetical protein [Bacillus horti]